jgi:hypothetical protein
MKKEPITLIGVGDVIIDREQPETIFRHVAEVIRSADIAYANCDQVYSDKGQPNPAQVTGSDPRNIPVLLSAGFDVVSLANNHAYDWGQEALLDTLIRLQEAGLPYVGVGKNLSEARRPVILERKGTKVGFLACSMVHPKGYEAEEKKPGVNPIRVRTFYEQVDFQPGTPPRIITIPYKEDLAAMVEDIKKLRAQVDVVIVAPHWGQHRLPRIIPMYCFDVGHAAIDAGADLVIGTHTHILKGIEVYKGKVIFYSTHNFAAEIGAKTWNLSMSDSNASFLKRISGLYKDVRDSETYRRQVRSTLIVKAIIEDGKIKQVSYIPCYLNEKLEPEIVTRSDARGQEVYNYVEDISRSESLPVHFSWDGDEVLIMP